MLKYASALILALSFFNSPANGQRHVPGETPPPVPRPVKPPVAKPPAPTTGTLSVTTIPAVARIVIKNSQGRTIKGASQDGKYQTELRWGAYTIEVSADNYVSQTLKVEVERGKTATVPIQLTPTSGALLINLGALGPDATILIDNKKPTSLARKSGNLVELDDLPAGAHTLRITHPSIAPHEEQVVVEGGKTIPVTPTFKLAVANLRIKSEPEANIFVDGRMEGQTTSGGELLITTSPGRHTIKAEKERFEPAEKTEEFKIGDQMVEVKLPHIKTSPEFADTFQEGTTLWDAPKTWRVNRSKMLVKGQEIGLARNLIYENFIMVFDISFTNQKGAVWIVRARDKKNYYLFQLSGPKGAHPRSFRSFIYQNGQPTLLRSDQVVEDLSRPNDFYHITIEAKGNTIKHFIQLKSNPAAGAEPLSTLTDSTFAYGGIGFGAIDDEEFEVFFVNITPDSSGSR
jgi:hypothetical protein